MVHCISNSSIGHDVVRRGLWGRLGRLETRPILFNDVAGPFIFAVPAAVRPDPKNAVLQRTEPPVNELGAGLAALLQVPGPAPAGDAVW